MQTSRFATRSGFHGGFEKDAVVLLLLDGLIVVVGSKTLLLHWVVVS